jgi:hypothetical protein
LAVAASSLWAGEPPERVGLPPGGYADCLKPEHAAVRLAHGRQAEAWLASIAEALPKAADHGRSYPCPEKRPVEAVHCPLRLAQTGMQRVPAIERLAVAPDGQVSIRLLHGIHALKGVSWDVATCLRVRATPERARDLLARCRDLTLRVTARGVIESFAATPGQRGRLVLVPLWKDLRVTIARFGEAMPDLAATPVRDEPEAKDAVVAEVSPEAHVEGEETRTTWTPAVSDLRPRDMLRRAIFAADFDGLISVGGYWPEAKGFYARDAPATIKDAGEDLDARRVAVLEHDDCPAGMSRTLDPPLPPGRYLVMFSTVYFRSRFFDTIVRVELGGQTREVAFSYPLGWGEGRYWFRAPAFDLDRPADRLTVSCSQIGGGGRSTAPDYPRRTLVLDRFFITNVMEDWDADHLARSREDAAEGAKP